VDLQARMYNKLYTCTLKREGLRFRTSSEKQLQARCKKAEKGGDWVISPCPRGFKSHPRRHRTHPRDLGDVHFLVRKISAPLMHPTYSKPLSISSHACAVERSVHHNILEWSHVRVLVSFESDAAKHLHLKKLLYLKLFYFGQLDYSQT